MKQGCVAAIAATCVVVAANMAMAQTDWDMSIVWPEGNFHTQNAIAFAEAVKEATGGEVNITVHSGGALGIKGPEGMAAVRDGLVPIAEVLLNQQVGEAPVLGIETMPYIAPTLEDLKLLHQFFRPKLDEVAEQMNQKVLYVVPWPGQGLYSPNKVETMADMKGLTIRVVDANGTEFFETLGAVPIQMPWGEVVPSLAAGTVKGVTTSSSSGVDGTFWEFMKHFNPINWQSSSNALIVNLDAWNALEPETQAIIEETARKMEPQFWQNSLDEDDQKIAILKEHGMEVTQTSPELRAELLQKAQPLWEHFKARVPESVEIIDAYMAARD